MIARDNETTIGPAIEVIRECVDDIVVVDTGSKDRTPEIAASFGARVFHFAWCDDFSAARNESIRQALGQWIFWMDTDDVIDELNARKVRKLVEDGGSRIEDGESRTDGRVPVLGYLMKVRCPSVGENGDAGYVEVDQVKLFRNLPQLRFEFRIHEQVLMSIRRAGGTAAWTDIFVVHANSDQSPEGRAKKLERDLRILRLDYQERPDHPFVLFNLGMTLIEAGRLKQEVGEMRLLEQKETEATKNDSFVSSVAFCLSSSVTCFERAIGHLWHSIGRAGDDDSHLRKTFALLVSSYRQLGRQVTAWEACLKGLKQFPDDAELRFRQAVMLRDYGNLPDAARAFEDLLSLDAKKGTGPIDQNGPAGAAHQLDQSPFSRRHLSSVDRGLNGYRARHTLAGIYADLADPAKAETLWRQVLAEVPSFRPAWHGLGDVLVRQGKTDEALRLAEQMEQQNGLANDARLLRVDALARLGKTSLARDELNAAIQTTPDDLNLLECRCLLVFEHFPPSEAESAFRDLLARDPQNAAAHHNLGSILYKLRRYDESAAAYRESLRLRPNSASTYLHLGYALRETGGVVEATTAWEEALKLAPNDQTVLQELQEARQQSAG